MRYAIRFRRRSGMNQFTIDSDFGCFEADGNEMLLQRLKEIDAIARLQEVSRTDEFKKSLSCGKKPAQLGEEHRQGSVTGDFQCSKRSHEILGARQGERSRTSVKKVAERRRREQDEGRHRLFGQETKDRAQMGIDPYSTNTVLQKAAGRRRLGVVGWWIHL